MYLKQREKPVPIRDTSSGKSTYINNFQQEHSSLSQSALGTEYYAISYNKDPIDNLYGGMEEFYGYLQWLSADDIQENKQYYDRELSGYDVLCYR